MASNRIWWCGRAADFSEMRTDSCQGLLCGAFFFEVVLVVYRRQRCYGRTGQENTVEARI